MVNITTGTEQSDWDLASSEQLEIDAANTTYTLTADRNLQIVVQLGNAAALLANAGAILGITVKVTPADTGDKCVMQQKQMNLPSGEALALISMDPFWAESGSIIEVHAKSTAAADSAVGGIVWLNDITPTITSALVLPHAYHL